MPKIVFVFSIIIISACEVFTLVNFQAIPDSECFFREKTISSDIEEIIGKMKNNSKVKLDESGLYANEQKKKIMYYNFKIKASLTNRPPTPTITLSYEAGNYSVINLRFKVWVQDFTHTEKTVLQEILSFLEKEFQEINYILEKTSIPFMSRSSKWAFVLERKENISFNCKP